jgi:CRISPR-associated protein Csx17
MTTVNTIALEGCQPAPLLHYLKALGVLRLVAEQFDPQVRGAWRGRAFVLSTTASASDLARFFLEKYCPSPVVAPWNGGSGFYPQDKNQRAMLNALCDAPAARFDDYRAAVAAAREVVGTRTVQPKDEEKAELLRHARRVFPDEALKWLDAAFVLGDDKTDYPPLLGSGGNDGRLDFTINFIARLLSVLPEAIERDSRDQLRDVPEDKAFKVKERVARQAQARLQESETQLRAALFGDTPATLEKAAVGQFYPAGAGGANATQRARSDESYVNPWDFILAIEGTLILASATVRQLAAGARSRASFPFTAHNSTIGYGTATENEKMRAEMWLPLWSRPTSYLEIAQVFGEGRVQFSGSHRQSARTGFDFARAVAELGVDRGIDAFQRYAFIERNGQANLALPLGRFEVPKSERPRAALVHEIDYWLERLRRATGDAKRTPPRFTRARRRIEEAIFNLCASGQAEHLRETLIALGAAEAAVATSPRFRDEHNLPPLAGLTRAGLTEAWAEASDDGTDEFAIALALSSITGDGERDAMRASLEPVTIEKTKVAWTNRDGSAVWGTNTLEDNLASVINRRSIDARRDTLTHPAVAGRRHASLIAVAAFLTRKSDNLYMTDDAYIEDLFRGLALIDWKRASRSERKRASITVPATLPRAYALLKLLFLRDGKLYRRGSMEPITIKHEPRIVPLLRAARVDEAIELAARRLRATELAPLDHRFHFNQQDGTRLAAALLIPIESRAATALADLVLREEEEAIARM